jgi:hypothetical protein
LADTRDFTWVLPPEGNVMRDRLNIEFLRAGLALPENVVETPSMPVITSLLQESDMLAPLAVNVAAPLLVSRQFVQLDLPLDLRLGVSGIITALGHRLTPVAQSILGTLRAAAGFSQRV